MNLSEKLAAADDPTAEETVTPEVKPAPRAPRADRRTGSRRLSDRTANEEAWSHSKRKVQQMVLAEVAPGAADLPPDQLRAKVRSTVSEILEREDIGISPVEQDRKSVV